MGYSVATPAKSGKAKAEMLEFMSEHFRPAHEFIPEVVASYDPSSSGILTDDQLAYDRGSSKMGFNYSTSTGPEGEYLFFICKWMALKVGRKRRFKEYGLPDTSVPYYVYDGHEAIPVLPRSQWEDVLDLKAVRFTDDLGMDPDTRTARTVQRNVERDPNWFDEAKKRLLGQTLEDEARHHALIREELQRLEQEHVGEALALFNTQREEQ